MSKKKFILRIILAALCGFEMKLKAVALNYSHLDQHGMNCKHMDSCARIGNATFFERTCECDKTCIIYGDCCIDAPYQSALSQYNSSFRWTCVSYGENTDDGAYVVNRCPLNFVGNPDLRQMCEGPNDLRDPLMTAVPVTDLASHVTYRNRPCAECNDASVVNLILWKVALVCKGTQFSLKWTKNKILRSLKYRQKSWGIDTGDSFHKCELGSDLPNKAIKVQQCRTHVISTCPVSWNDQEVKRNCLSYMGIVYAKNGKVAFRNIDCAICNGISVDSLTCDLGITSRVEEIPMSFTLLLDYNYLNENNGNKVGLTIKANPTCPVTHVYDPFSKKCREIVCSIPGYVLRDGKCDTA